jgi:hypothetical protein
MMDNDGFQNFEDQFDIVDVNKATEMLRYNKLDMNNNNNSKTTDIKQ